MSYPVQWIGHPIANDPCYGGELHFGDPASKLRVEKDPCATAWKGTSCVEAATAAGTTAEAGGASPEGLPCTGAVAVTGIGDGPRTATGGKAAGGVNVVMEGDQDRSLESEGRKTHPRTGTGPSVRDAHAAGGAREAVPAGDVDTQRDDEDDEAFMVGSREIVSWAILCDETKQEPELV